MKVNLDELHWEEVLRLLKNNQVPPDQIGHAIVLVGKPFDERRMQAAKETVASYLTHPDSWARHEAMWFLASWYRLREFKAMIQSRLHEDPDEDNRSFAATCLGRLEEGSKDSETLIALGRIVASLHEAPMLRVGAYCAFLQVYYGPAADGVVWNFLVGSKGLNDMDMGLVETIQQGLR